MHRARESSCRIIDVCLNWFSRLSRRPTVAIAPNALPKTPSPKAAHGRSCVRTCWKRRLRSSLTGHGPNGFAYTLGATRSCLSHEDPSRRGFVAWPRNGPPRSGHPNRRRRRFEGQGRRRTRADPAGRRPMGIHAPAITEDRTVAGGHRYSANLQFELFRIRTRSNPKELFKRVGLVYNLWTWDNEVKMRWSGKFQCSAHFQPSRLEFAVNKDFERLEGCRADSTIAEHVAGAFIVVVKADHHKIGRAHV